MQVVRSLYRGRECESRWSGKRPWVWGAQRTWATTMITASAELLGRSPKVPWQVEDGTRPWFLSGQEGKDSGWWVERRGEPSK